MFEIQNENDIEENSKRNQSKRKIGRSAHFVRKYSKIYKDVKRKKQKCHIFGVFIEHSTRSLCS